MKNISLVTTLLCCATVVPCYSQMVSRMPMDINQYVGELVSPIMNEYSIPGLSVGLSVDGQHMFFNYGVASKESKTKINEKTIFELGSISKTFTATLTSLAQEKGLLNLADPVSIYMPELQKSALDQVKLYHLVTHTAGGFELQLPDEVSDGKQLIDFYRSWQPKYPAGTQRIYTNPSIGLLGIIAGKSFKKPFKTAMVEEVFDKLGLNNTFYDIPTKSEKNYAQGYNKNNEPVRLSAAMLADEAYGVKSSTADMVKFLDANMGFGKLTPSIKAALKKTHTGYFNTSVMTQDMIWEQYPYPVSLKQLQLGNGYEMIYQTNPVKEIIPPLAPSNDVLINKTGSTNGFGGYVMFIPNKKIGIVILANKNFPNSARVNIAYQILSFFEQSAKIGGGTISTQNE